MNRYKNILLVEDDEDDRDFFLDVLKEVDPTANCRVASNGARALKLLRSAPPLPELIILDLNMPVMSGLEFLRLLRSDAALQHIPVIILTTSTKEVNKCYDLGANIYISKPTSEVVFCDIMRYVLSNDVVKNAELLQVLFARSG